MDLYIYKYKLNLYMTKKELKSLIREVLEESIVNYTTEQLEKIEEYRKTAYIVSGYDSSNGSVILTNPADGNTITIDKNGNEKTLGTYKRMN